MGELCSETVGIGSNTSTRASMHWVGEFVDPTVSRPIQTSFDGRGSVKNSCWDRPRPSLAKQPIAKPRNWSARHGAKLARLRQVDGRAQVARGALADRHPLMRTMRGPVEPSRMETKSTDPSPCLPALVQALKRYLRNEEDLSSQIRNST